MARNVIRSTIAQTAVIAPFCTVTDEKRNRKVELVDRLFCGETEFRWLTADDLVQDVICGREASLVSPLQTILSAKYGVSSDGGQGRE